MTVFLCNIIACTSAEKVYYKTDVFLQSAVSTSFISSKIGENWNEIKGSM